MLGYIYRIPSDKIDKTGLFSLHTNNRSWYAEVEIKLTRTGQMFSLAGLEALKDVKQTAAAKSPKGFYIFVPEDLDIDYKLLDKLSNYKYGPIDKEYQINNYSWNISMSDDDEVYIRPDDSDVNIIIYNTPPEYIEEVCTQLSDYVRMFELLSARNILYLYSSITYEYRWDKKLSLMEQVEIIKKTYMKKIIAEIDEDDYGSMAELKQMVELVTKYISYFPEKVKKNIGIL